MSGYRVREDAVNNCREFIAREVHGLHPTDHALALRELQAVMARWAAVVETENDKRGVPERS